VRFVALVANTGRGGAEGDRSRRRRSARVLIVANRTAATPALLEAVAGRASRGPSRFHLVVPATPRGLHRLVDPEVTGREEAERSMAVALPLLSAAAGTRVEGHVGDPSPLAAVEDAIHLVGVDEIIISTLPRKVSRWIRMDLPSKVAALGFPVIHVDPNAVDACLVGDSPRRARVASGAA
jgi:hypothetical protein